MLRTDRIHDFIQLCESINFFLIGLPGNSIKLEIRILHDTVS